MAQVNDNYHGGVPTAIRPDMFPVYPSRWFERTDTFQFPFPAYEPAIKFQEPVSLVRKVWLVVDGRQDEDGCDRTETVSVHKTREGADAHCLELYKSHKEKVILQRKRDRDRQIAVGACSVTYLPGCEPLWNKLDDSPILSPYWVEEWELHE